ncbi:MAG: hypothetical protein K6A66_07250 [Streptococcus sp.]|uniref:hypothetical protein n=1 Tax=Streptococcus sp. TaxID=1306 RepID=UPI002587E229|nr:hypothetical protein [Streptococcus sp.]MCR5052471.1 hypothetical protein [Streptococcus sp.]
MDKQDMIRIFNNNMAFIGMIGSTIKKIMNDLNCDETTALEIYKLSYQIANNQNMKEVTDMKHEELTLTELKEWTKSARNLVEHLQDDYHDYLPTGKAEAFGSITNSIYNCLDCLVEMFNNDELELVDCTIDPMENVVDDNQADEMAQYNELMKEVEGSDKEAREIVCYEYDDTIHEYIDKRTEQLKEQADVEELVNKVARYEAELIDYAERLLSDEPLNADSETAIETLDMLDDEAIDLFKSIDVDDEYQGLEYYNTELNKED